MSMQLKLYEPNSPGTFLQQECRRRLMWAVLVSDLLFESNSHIDVELLMDVPLPCNLWSFTQGQPCRTLTLRQLRGVVEDEAIKQSSNHCAYLINILVIRRKILTCVHLFYDPALSRLHLTVIVTCKKPGTQRWTCLGFQGLTSPCYVKS